MDALAGILFQMDAFYPNPPCDARPHVDQHFALAHDGMIQLADLVSLRQIGVEIVLAIEGRAQVDRGFQAESRAHRLFDTELVDDGQHPGHGGVDEGDV